MEQIGEDPTSQYTLAIKGKERDVDENGPGTKGYKIWEYLETFFINRWGKTVGKTSPYSFKGEKYDPGPSLLSLFFCRAVQGSP
jgi:hypothetical protein